MTVNLNLVDPAIQVHSDVLVSFRNTFLPLQSRLKENQNRHNNQRKRHLSIIVDILDSAHLIR